jgi:glutamine synthetase
MGENGIEEIYKRMEKLLKNHEEHIIAYGDERNRERLTGHHETSSYDKFSYGVGTRNTSVRIPTQCVKDGYGYFEDRRPASNMDPYKVTSLIYKTCCLDE